ncbi:MAG: aldo/keto reductase, partial [Gammaproteobacteria bacterium]
MSQKNPHALNESRRSFLKTASSVCLLPLASITPFTSLFAGGRQSLAIHKKTIPSTAEQIPVIGMGSWGTFDVGLDKSDRARCVKILRMFFDMGGGMIDSSPMYGSSQGVIGHC